MFLVQRDISCSLRCARSTQHDQEDFCQNGIYHSYRSLSKTWSVKYDSCIAFPCSILDGFLLLLLLFLVFLVFFFPTFLCFVSSLWVIERPLYMLQADSPAAVKFSILAFITLHCKRLHKIGFRLNLYRSMYYSCSSNQALLEHFLNMLLCVQMFQE